VKFLLKSFLASPRYFKLWIWFGIGPSFYHAPTSLFLTPLCITPQQKRA
jgi:hypothetical protein